MARRTPAMTVRTRGPGDRYAAILGQTDRHRAGHGCGAYPFRDGPALGVLVAATGACRVLELGTALGYSACWLAHAAPEARVDTIERDATHAALARDNIAANGFADRVRVLEGDFDDILPTLEAGYDAAFIDGYAPTFRQLQWVRSLLRQRGVLITANLNLAGADPVRAALEEPNVWMTAPLLENGTTMVSVAL